MEKDLTLIKNFIDRTTSSVCYLNISAQLMQSLSLSIDKDFCVIDLNRVVSPLKPFLLVLKDCNPSEQDIEENVYSLHKDFFKSFIKNGRCNDRHDIIIEQEYFYEKKRIRRSIVSILEKLNTKKYLFLNTQCLLNESLEIISEIEKSSVKGKFVFCFDTLDNNMYSESSQNYVEKVSNQLNFLNIPVTDEDIILSSTLNTSKAECVQFSFFKNLNDFNTIFDTLRNYRLFLAFEESKLINTWMAENIQNMAVTQPQKRKLYLEMAKISYDNDNLDEAALYLNNIIDYQTEEDTEQEALFYLSKIFAKKKANTDALKYITALKGQLKNNKESWLYAMALNNEYLVTLRKADESGTTRYEEAITLLKNAGLINNYIATSLNIPWTFIATPSYQIKLQQQLDESMKHAIQIDNQHLISSICHRKAIILSHYGKSEQAMQFNMECNRIRTEIGELQPLLAIRNGLSYEMLNRAKYVEAYNYVNDIIGKIYTINDYCTIIDTLKNISYAVFFSRHFEEADQLFSIILHFLSSFNLMNAANNSFLPSVNDIMIYRSIICIHNNDMIHAQMNHLTITSNNEMISEVDRPLLHYIKACVYADEGQIEKAQEEFENCIIEYQINSRTQVHKMVFVCYEFAIILKKNGFNQLSDKILNEGFKLAEENGLTYYTKFQNSVSLDDYINGVQQLNPLGISLAFLQEKAEKDRLMNQLHHKLYDYQFLNKIKSFNGTTSNIKKYLEITISSIMDYTTARQIIFAEKSGKENWKKIIDSTRRDPIKIPSSMWNYYYSLSNYDSQLIWDSKNELYYAILSKFEFNFAFILVPHNSRQMSSDTLSVLNIALSNILAQLIMFKQNENLLFLSTTDQLSMLKNRRALQDFVNEESDKLSRLKCRKKILINKTIAFIDLDNFKYYNDTFGHIAGDLIIQNFSILLKKIFRRCDFISRFGGDEFVIVMSDTSKDEALKVIKRLRTALKDCDYFLLELSQQLNVLELNIPEKRLLGFSVGICTNTDLDDACNLNDVMRNADVALYYSKEHGKGITTSWSDMRK